MSRQHHRLLNFLAIVILAVSSSILCGCSEGNAHPEPEPLKLQISITKSFSAAIGDEVILKYYKGPENPQNGDVIVFKSSKNEFVCPITRVDLYSFSFKITEKMPDGSYELLVRRGEREQHLGRISFTFIDRVVIEDREGFNIYGQISCEGKGVPGVVVSDGIQVTTTDADGIYYLESTKKYNYVWMSIPSGYEALSEGVLPLFCHTLKAPVTVHERVDFELVRTDNDRFTMYILGDMHLAKRNNDLAQFKLFADDLNETIDLTPGPEYVLTLGDMTWDFYWYTERYSFTEYIATINSHFKDIQFFHTMGNHDNDYLGVGDLAKEIPYCTHLTPTFYSYNIGQVHFIVMDDIDFNNTGADIDTRHLYTENFTADQMRWLEKDLSYVSKDTPIVFSTHAPVFTPTVLGWRHRLTGASELGEGDTQDLLDAFKGYTVHIFTGHTHRTFCHDLLDSQKVFEHNGGSICGDWWWSGKLTPNILLAQDGAPSGYTILSVDGKDIKWLYKANGYPKSHQFNAYDMNEVKRTVTMSLGFDKPKWAPYVQRMSDHGQNVVLLNIWNYDPEWKIEVTEDGKPLEVKARFDYDPLHIIALTAKRFATTDDPKFLTASWTHFFEVQASSPDSDLEIKVTDRFGNVSKESMKRPKAFQTDVYLP